VAAHSVQRRVRRQPVPCAQQFFKWLAAEEEIPDPMAGLRPPHVPDSPVPVFAAGDLALLERACAGRSFQQRRDAAVIAVFGATGMRLSELAGIRYDPRDPQRSGLDLWHREITVHGKGICQVIVRRGRQCGIGVFPHRFRHHFSHTWLDRGGAEGDLMELNGWSSPQMLRRYGASARSARARRSYDRIMENQPLPHPSHRAQPQAGSPSFGAWQAQLHRDRIR
jgi:integrase/recombinase XerD